MKKIADCFFTVAEQINPYSKWIIRIGSVLVFAVYFAALVLALSAGKRMDYEYAMYLCNEFLHCGKECIGAVYIPAVLLEIFLLLGGKTQNEEKKK